jgi:hypothetical protein
MRKPKVGTIARNFSSQASAKAFQNILNRQFHFVKLLIRPRFFGFGKYQWLVGKPKNQNQ